jgi:hypothetical protein
MKTNKKQSLTLMAKRYIFKSDKIFNDKSNTPVAVSVDDFDIGDIGFVDDSMNYPVEYNDNFFILPGFRKILVKKKERKCKKLKKKE